MLPEVQWIPFVCSRPDFSDIWRPSFAQLENGKLEERVIPLIKISYDFHVIRESIRNLFGTVHYPCSELAIRVFP